MRSEMIGEYEIEYEGVMLKDVDGWAAYLSIYGPSPNPMHRNNIFPLRHVSVDTVFPTEEAAEREARRVAMSMIHH